MCISQSEALLTFLDIFQPFVAAILLFAKDTAEYEQWRDERLILGVDPDGVNAQSLTLWHLNCTEVEQIGRIPGFGSE